MCQVAEARALSDVACGRRVLQLSVPRVTRGEQGALSLQF